MEQLVDTVSAVRPDHTAVLAFRVLLNNVAILAEKRARLDDLNSLV